MLNKVMLIGRLGQKPELRYTAGGVPVATLSVATDDSYTDKDGNRVARTEWHRVVIFQRAAENCAQYLDKGSQVYVEGAIHTRKWEDQAGQNRYSMEINARRVQFLGRRPDSNSEQEEERPLSNPIGAKDDEPPFPSDVAGSMDDIPF